MLLEFIKETQPQLEKLATNGFRNFYNFQSTKGNTIYLYEDGKNYISPKFRIRWR